MQVTHFLAFHLRALLVAFRLCRSYVSWSFLLCLPFSLFLAWPSFISTCARLSAISSIINCFVEPRQKLSSQTHQPIRTRSMYNLSTDTRTGVQISFLSSSSSSPSSFFHSLFVVMILSLRIYLPRLALAYLHNEPHTHTGIQTVKIVYSKSLPNRRYYRDKVHGKLFFFIVCSVPGAADTTGDFWFFFDLFKAST